MGKKHDRGCKGGDDCRDERHLCKISSKGDHEVVRSLVRDAIFFCGKCGRAARDRINLCRPEEI